MLVHLPIPGLSTILPSVDSGLKLNSEWQGYIFNQQQMCQWSSYKNFTNSRERLACFMEQSERGLGVVVIGIIYNFAARLFFAIWRGLFKGGKNVWFCERDLLRIVSLPILIAWELDFAWRIPRHTITSVPVPIMMSASMAINDLNLWLMLSADYNFYLFG